MSDEVKPEEGEDDVIAGEASAPKAPVAPILPAMLDDIDARETVIVAGSLAAIAMGIFYGVARMGFENPPMPVIGAVAVSLFLTTVPYWANRLGDYRRFALGQWWMSQPALTLMALLTAVLVGMLSSATLTALAFLPGVIGAALAGWTAVRWIRRGRPGSSLLFVVGTVVLVAWAAGMLWAFRYKTPLYWENFALNANLHHDPIYFSAMARMLETYGVASTGIDGIPLIHYHYGSAWVFGTLAHLIGTDVLTFYSLGYPIIVVPFFFCSLLLLAIEIRRSMPLQSEKPLRADYRVWLVFACATIGFLPTGALNGLGVWNANVLLSESYLLGMSVFLLGIAAGVVFWRSDSFAEVSRLNAVVGEKPIPGKATLSFVFAFLPIVILMLGFFKVSLMLLFVGLLTFVALRLRLWKWWPVAMGLAVSAVTTALTYSVVSFSGHNGGLSPLDFMRFNVAEGWEQFFPIVSLMWTWAYVVARLWEEEIVNTRQLWTFIISRRLLDVEIVVLIAILGFIPGELISIHGGSAFYFSDVQRWVSLAFIVARLGVWSRRLREMRDARAERRPTGGWNTIRLSTVLAVFVLAPFALTLVVNTVQWPIRAVARNLAIRSELVKLTGRGGNTADPGLLREGLRSAEYTPVISALRAVSRLPRSERATSALFIPQTYEQYWRMWDNDGRCAFVPLVAPAIAGVAMIDGMPPYGCPGTTQYNMSAYRPRTRPQSVTDGSNGVLCARAKADGLTQILVLDGDGASKPSVRRITCP